MNMVKTATQMITGGNLFEKSAGDVEAIDEAMKNIEDYFLEGPKSIEIFIPFKERQGDFDYNKLEARTPDTQILCGHLSKLFQATGLSAEQIIEDVFMKAEREWGYVMSDDQDFDENGPKDARGMKLFLKPDQNDS